MKKTETLNSELIRLYNKAFQLVPNSPAQLKIRKKIEELRKKLLANCTEK